MKKLLFALLATGCIDEQSVGSTSNNTTHVFGAPRWALTLGDIYDDGGASLGIASNGDVLVAGGFMGNVDFGGTVHAAGTDFLTAGTFLTRRAAADGHELWTQTQADSSLPSVGKIAIAPDDTIVGVGGYIKQGVWNGGVGPVEVPQLSKLDSSGMPLWRYDFDLGVNLWSVDVAPDGRIAVGGSYQKTIQLPSGPVSSPDGNAFIEVFDKDGTPLWGLTSDTLALAPFPEIDVVRFTAESDLVVTGEVHELSTIAHVPIQNTARNTEFAARFTVDGNLIWTKVLTAANQEEWAGGMFVDALGRTTIAGTLRVDPDMPMDNGKPDLQVLDATGTLMGSHPATSGSAVLVSMAVSGDGTIFTSGTTQGFPIDLGSGTLTTCAYLAAQDANGNILDVDPFVGPGPSSCGESRTLLAARGGTLAMTGAFDQSIDLGSGALRHAGGADVVIAVYDVP